MCLMVIASSLWADGENYDNVLSETFHLDVRTTIGGRMLHDTERISPVAENETTGAKLMVDQKTATGWTVANPSYNK